MAVESAADRASFLDADEHGVSVTIMPETGAPVTISAIFDEPYGLVGEDPDTDGFSGSEPIITVRSADLPTGELRGAKVSLTDSDGNSRLFRIVEPKPDGTGMTELRLSKLET